MSNWILKNAKNYVFSALTASVDGSVRFEPLGEGGSERSVGQLRIPMEAKFVINDGQHRRAAIEAVRKVILKNLDKDYEEGMLYGMIGYYVPHRIFPAGYHCDPTKPLCFAALASQKNALSLSPNYERWKVNGKG